MNIRAVERVAERLTRDARDHLIGDRETACGAARLRLLGAIDTEGRLTAFGVTLARHVMAAQVPTWSEDDSIALTVALVKAGARMRLRGREREAAVAALAEAGWSGVKMAERIGGQSTSISKTARKIGVQIRRQAPGGVTRADEMKILACERGHGKQWVELW